MRAVIELAIRAPIARSQAATGLASLDTRVRRGARLRVRETVGLADVRAHGGGRQLPLRRCERSRESDDTDCTERCPVHAVHGSRSSARVVNTSSLMLGSSLKFEKRRIVLCPVLRFVASWTMGCHLPFGLTSRTSEKCMDLSSCPDRSHISAFTMTKLSWRIQLSRFE